MKDKEKTAEITLRIEIMQEGVVADNFLKIKEFRLGSGYDGYSQQRCDVFAISPNKGNKTNGTFICKKKGIRGYNKPYPGWTWRADDHSTQCQDAQY